MCHFAKQAIKLNVGRRVATCFICRLIEMSQALSRNMTLLTFWSSYDIEWLLKWGIYPNFQFTSTPEDRVTEVTLHIPRCICTRFCPHLIQKRASDSTENTLKSLVVQLLSRVWLYNPMNCSMLGFPVLHYLQEFGQTHVHWVGDAIQPSHPLSPADLALNLFQHQGLCQWVGIRWPKYWSFSFSVSPFNEYSGLISFRMDWFDLPAVQGTLRSLPAPQFKSINSSALNLLYDPTLTSIHDYWKNHGFKLSSPKHLI